MSPLGALRRTAATPDKFKALAEKMKPAPHFSLFNALTLLLIPPFASRTIINKLQPPPQTLSRLMMNPQAVVSLFLLLAASLGGSADAKPPKIQCALGCPMDFNPVCSFDGLMYTQFSNPCELGIVSCQGVNAGKVPLNQKACPTNQQVCGNKYYCGKTQACVLDRVRAVNYCAIMCNSVTNNCKSTEVCVQQEPTTCLQAPCPTQDTCVPRLAA